MQRIIRVVALLAAFTAVTAAPAAQAHVTLQPDEVAAGGFERLDVRVPNEREDASTQKVEGKFPPGIIFISHEPVPGWAGKVKMAKLAKPVEAFGERQTEQVDSVTFTTRGKGIAPGQFRDFGLSLSVPDKANSTLAFKALQTYSDGEVVRWIGPPDAEEPAAQVKVTAAEGEAATAHGGGQGAREQAQLAAVAASERGADRANTLAVIALVVGALGLLAGAGALVVARRSRATA